LSLDDYFAKWINDYAQYHHSAGWQQTEHVIYRKYIQPILGLHSIREIQPLDIRRVLNEMRKRGMAESYANRCRQMLHKMFNEAVSTYRYLPLNPVSAIKPYRELPKHTLTLTKNEANRLLTWADGHDLGLGIHLALSLGLRQGEVCGLKWDTINFEGRSITIRRKFQKKVNVLEEFAKGKKIRVLGLYPDGLLCRLKAQKERNPQSEFVVCRPSGSMVTAMQLISCLGKGLAATQIRRVTFHGLRHTFASLFMESGGDLYDLQKIMGHEAVATTERYRHTDPEYLRQQCSRLDLYSAGPLTQVSSAQIPPKNGKEGRKLVSI